MIQVAFSGGVHFGGVPFAYMLCPGWLHTAAIRPWRAPACLPSSEGGDMGVKNVDTRLPGKGNSNSHGARPAHQTISMIRWIRTSRLLIKNSQQSDHQIRCSRWCRGSRRSSSPTRARCEPPWSRVEGKSQVNLPQCHLFDVAFVWGLTNETIHLHLGCLQGGVPSHFLNSRTHF